MLYGTLVGFFVCFFFFFFWGGGGGGGGGMGGVLQWFQNSQCFLNVVEQTTRTLLELL